MPGTGSPNTTANQGRAGLTARELEVLDLVQLGLTNAALAERLRVSVHAVKFHLASIYRKLGVANRTEAVAAYLRPGAVVTERRADDESTRSSGWT